MNKKVLVIGGSLVLLAGIVAFASIGKEDGLKIKQEKKENEVEDVIREVDIEKYEVIDESKIIGENQKRIKSIYENAINKKSYRNNLDIKVFYNEEIIERKSIFTKYSKDFGYQKRYVQKQNGSMSIMIDKEGRKFYSKKDLIAKIGEENFEIKTNKEWIELKNEDIVGVHKAKEIKFEKRINFIKKVNEEKIEKIKLSEYEKDTKNRYKIIIENDEIEEEAKEMIGELGIELNDGIKVIEILITTDKNDLLLEEELVVRATLEQKELFWEINNSYSDWMQEMEFEEDMSEENKLTKEEY